MTSFDGTAVATLVVPPMLFGAVPSSVEYCLSTGHSSIGRDPKGRADEEKRRRVEEHMTGWNATTGPVHLVAYKSNLCDIGWAAMFSHLTTTSLGTRLDVLDLSFASLTVRVSWPTLREVITSVAPRLKSLLLIGNFRPDFGFPTGSSLTSSNFQKVTGFVDELVQCWSTHETLWNVKLDPWLETSAFQKLRNVKSKRQRELLVKNCTTASPAPRGQRAFATMQDYTSAGLRSSKTTVEFEGRRKSTFVFSQEDIAKELRAVEMTLAGEDDDKPAVGELRRKVSLLTTHIEAEGAPATLELQVAEHKRREKIMRNEEAARTLICKDSGAGSQRMERARSHRIRAMSELEEEMRLMLTQREEEGRRKILGRATLIIAS